MATKVAEFPFVRDLEGFDWSAQPSIDQRQIRELASGRWIAHGDRLLLLGRPGVGKTHLAVSLGRAAILQNYTVQFVPAATLVATLAKPQSGGRLDEQLTTYGRPKLLIVDELGVLLFEPEAAHPFFQLVSRRYERGSVLITSNPSVGEWGLIFCRPPRCHHSQVIAIRGDSYRLREKLRAGLLKATTPDPPKARTEP